MNPFLSIKGRLLTFALCISLIPIAVTTTIYYLHVRSALKYRILEDLKAIAESREQHVLSYMERIEIRTADFSTDGFIRRCFEVIVRGGNSKQDAVVRLNKYLSKKKLPLNRHLIAIALVDKNGKAVSSTDERLIGKDFSRHDVFMQGMRKSYGETNVGQLQYSPDLGAECTFVSAPIMARPGVETLGVIINAYSPSALNEITTNRIGMGETGEVYLVSRDKVMITQSRFMDDSAFKQVVDTEPVHKLIEDGRKTVGIYRDYRGIAVVGASIYLPEYGWTLLAEMDKAESFAPLKRLGLVAVFFGVVSAVATTGLGISFAVSTSSPIKDLKDAAERFAGGDLNYRVKVTRKDEIGALSRSFNAMAEELKREITEHKRAEEALRKTGASLANAQRIAHLGNWEWDILKSELRWSDEIYRIFGLVPQALGATYEAFLDSVHPADREFVKKAVNEALYERKPYNIDHRIVLPDGSERIVHEQAEVIFDNTGRAVQMDGTVQDITDRKRMEQVQDRLVAILEATTDFVGFADAKDTQILYVNRAGRKMTGIGEDEDVTKLRITDIQPGWTNKMFLDEIIPTAIRDGIWRGECAFLSRDGREIPVSMILMSHKTPGGTVEIFSTISRDISVRKRAEEEINLLLNITMSISEAGSFHSVLNIVLCKVCESTGWIYGEVWLPSSNGKYLECGQAWHNNSEGLEEFRKKSREFTFTPGVGLPGRVWSSKKPEWKQYIAEKREFPRAQYIKKSGFKAAMGIPVIANSEVIAVLNFFVREQREEDERLVMLVSSVAIQLGSVILRKRAEEELGKVNETLEQRVAERTAALVKVNKELKVEIAERKRIEEELRKLFNAVEQSSCSVVITDIKGNIEYVNPKFSRVTGYASEEAIGQNPRILKSGEKPPEEYKGLWDTITTGGEWEGEFHNKKKNGELYWEYASISPIKNQEGVITHFVAVKEDITERKRAEDELRKQRDHLAYLTNRLTAANKELEAFCYSVSHDLRAPLRSINGFSKALMEDCSDKLDSQGKNYLQRVMAASQYMGQLIDDLLNLSRITRSEIRCKTVDLSALAKKIAAELQEAQPERQAEFIIDEKLIAYGDPQLLRIALTNLLGNAWKFTRKRPRAKIELGVTKHDGKPVYFVRDNGDGFDMAFVNKLFGAFQRLHSTTEFEGTGIGLATVQRIIHRHGGQIWAEGAVDQGATFYFTI